MSLTARGITAGYRRGRPVIRDVDVDVAAGEVVGVAGPSGCGKSTLARVLTMLLHPWRGELAVDGRPVQGARHRVPRELRTSVAVVFQSPRRSVDPRFTLADVVAEPLRANGRRAHSIDREVRKLAERVDLTHDLLDRRPHEVSDGQLQRACVARALALRPRYLVCDEMTSMLDASTAAALVHVVNDEVTAREVGVVAISHDHQLLEAWAGRRIDLEPDGSAS